MSSPAIDVISERLSRITQWLDACGVVLRVAAPMVAYDASVLRARWRDAPRPAPFRYRHQGSLATIGRKGAVAEFGRVKLTGALAWWLWGAAHILFLVGMRNRLSVMLGWAWSYFTFKVSVRLITGVGPDFDTTAT